MMQLARQSTMPARRPRLAAVILTLDEAHNLRELLPELNWVDEMVVVDGGSRDDTVAIARQSSAHVVQHPFDVFAAQRNRGIAAATADWILSIDADERPSPSFARAVQRACNHGRHVAYRVTIRSRIFGRRMRFSGTQDDCPIRLFHKSAGQWQGAVHERLHVSGSVGRLAVPLEHVTLPDLPTFLAKMNRYTRLEAAQRASRGQTVAAGVRWWRGAREVARRLIWKSGWCDGPEGWCFCLLSGLSEWLLATRQRQWTAPREPAALRPHRPPRTEPARAPHATPSLVRWPAGETA